MLSRLCRQVSDCGNFKVGGLRFIGYSGRRVDVKYLLRIVLAGAAQKAEVFVCWPLHVGACITVQPYALNPKP